MCVVRKVLLSDLAPGRTLIPPRPGLSQELAGGKACDSNTSGLRALIMQVFSSLDPHLQA